MRNDYVLFFRAQADRGSRMGCSDSALELAVVEEHTPPVIAGGKNQTAQNAYPETAGPRKRRRYIAKGQGVAQRHGNDIEGHQGGLEHADRIFEATQDKGLHRLQVLENLIDHGKVQQGAGYGLYGSII